jgi:succinoglycan biosynthesis transport protein ExoP
MLLSNPRLGNFQSFSSPAPVSRPGAGFLDLRGFWLLLRRRTRLIAAILCATLLLAGLFLLVVVPQYSATAVVLVDPRQQKVVQAEAVLPGIGSDAAAVESQVEVIRSSPLMLRVIDKLGLRDDPEFTGPGLGGQITGFFGVSHAVDPERALLQLAASLQDRLWVQRRGLTYVLEIGFRSKDPAKAARIANAVAGEYLAEQTSAKQGATAKASTWLEGRIGELSNRVFKAERAIALYRARHDIVDTGEGRTLIDRQISELNQQLILARARTAEARSRFEQVRRAPSVGGEAGSPPEALNSPVIANLRTQYAQAARSDVEMTRTFGPRYPALQTNTAQMADLRQQIEREIARISAGLRNEFETAQSREKSLDASLATLKKQAAGAEQDSVQLRELQREAAASRTLLEQFLLRAKETTEQETLQIPEARILSAATSPLVPSSPKPGLLLAFALAGGLVLGIGSAAVLESLGRGFRTAAEVEEALGCPVWALLPKPVSAGQWGDSASGIEEGLRAVRTSLQGGAATWPQVTVVTSVLPGERASLLAASLAREIANGGRAALLVETSSAGGPATRGKARVQGGLEALPRHPSLASLIRVDETTGLHILSLGATGCENVVEMLTGVRGEQLLGDLRRRYPVILLDAPPILASADGRRLLDHADVVVLALRWNATGRDSVLTAIRLLDDNSEKVSGVVLTDVDLARYPLYDQSRPYGT